MTYNEARSPMMVAILKMAEENRLKFRREKAEGKSPTQILAEIITNPAVQVVLGIWPDETQPGGFGHRAIRGETQIERVFAGDKINCDALFCRCPEEAEAMRQTLGDDRGALH